MTAKTLRKIIRIDEDKCDGCGACVPACAEGAIAIVKGKARLVSETYCDGLGACLGECPRGAITIEERPAEAFDEVAAERHMQEDRVEEEMLPCGCPSSTIANFDRTDVSSAPPADGERPQSLLGHWPVQLTLVPPGAPFLQGADVVLSADCAPFACAGFHREFLRDRALLVACPKLDDWQAHLDRLTEILRQSTVRSITIVRMEVPCCSGLTAMARRAIAASGKDIPVREVTVGVSGELL